MAVSISLRMDWYCVFWSTNGITGFVRRLKVDSFAASAHGTDSGFDERDDAHSAETIRFGRGHTVDAIDEVLGPHLERLGAVELGRPHVTRAVADAHLVDLRG